MNLKPSFLSTALIASQLLAAASHAAAPAPTASTTSTETVPSLREMTWASYSGYFSGPSLANPSIHTLDTSTGDMTDMEGVDHVFTLGVSLPKNKKIAITGNFRFLSEFGGAGNSVRDPWLALKNGSVYSNGKFNLSMDVRAYIPVTSYERLYTSIRTTQTATYQANSRITLGMQSFLRGYVNRADLGGKNGDLFVSAFSNYAINDKIALTAWSDLVQHFYTFGKDGVDLSANIALGVSYDITPRWNINPQLIMVPSAVSLGNALEKTALTASISGKLL